MKRKTYKVSELKPHQFYRRNSDDELDLYILEVKSETITKGWFKRTKQTYYTIDYVLIDRQYRLSIQQGYFKVSALVPYKYQNVTAEYERK